MDKITKIIIAQAAIIAILIGNIALLWTKVPMAPASRKTQTVTTQPTTYSNVNWKIADIAPTTVSGYAGKTAPFHQTLSFDQPNLQTLRFDLTWTDDRVSIIGRRGLDTLTLIITGSDGTFYQSSATTAKWTRQGSVELSVPVPSAIPRNSSFPTPSTSETESELINRLSDYSTTGLKFTCIVLDNVNDRCLFSKLGDQGNTFSLQVTPAVYTATVTHTVLNS